MDVEKIVLDFCEAVKTADVQLLIPFFSQEAVYHNIPMEPVRGRAAIEATLGGFFTPGEESEFKILAIASCGNKVLTERIDILTMNGKRIELPVMRTFEIDGEGKISAWRDYFDMQQVTNQIG